ncbi:MAG: hypothetical protein AAGI28_02680 [Pseudomonadota bacterium]
MTSHSGNTTCKPNRGSRDGMHLKQKSYDDFLSYLAESSNVTRSADQAGLSKGAVYQRRRQDATFARKWLTALYEGYLHLELEVIRRLREGEMQGKNKDKYDFANAIRLLSAHRENAARAQAEQRNVTAAAVRASIDRKVEDIRQQVRQEKGRESNPH